MQVCVTAQMFSRYSYVLFVCKSAVLTISDYLNVLCCLCLPSFIKAAITNFSETI